MTCDVCCSVDVLFIRLNMNVLYLSFVASSRFVACFSLLLLFAFWLYGWIVLFRFFVIESLTGCDVVSFDDSLIGVSQTAN